MTKIVEASEKSPVIEKELSKDDDHDLTFGSNASDDDEVSDRSEVDKDKMNNTFDGSNPINNETDHWNLANRSGSEPSSDDFVILDASSTKPDSSSDSSSDTSSTSWLTASEDEVSENSEFEVIPAHNANLTFGSNGSDDASVQNYIEGKDKMNKTFDGSNPI